MPYLDYWNCIIWADSRSPETDEYYTRVVYASPANANELWKLNVTNATQFSWIKLAPATPPQEFDLPLAEGWTGLAKYYKTQENICFIELDILKNATIQNGEVLATLPEGFRPSYLRMQPAIVYSPHGSTTIGVSPTGSVLFGDMSGSPSARNIYATLVFVAAS